MKVTKVRLAAAAVVAVLALSGCSGQGSAGTPTQPSTLTITVGTPPATLDPAQSNSGSAELFFDLTYGSLIHAKRDGTFAPGLAEDFGYVGEGNTTFQITLRDDMAFADGTPLDAAAVKAYIEYFQEKQGPFANALANLTSIETPDDLTVVLTLSQPHPDLPLVFSEPSLTGAVVSPAGLADPDALGNATFGAGPYQLDSARSVAGSSYVLVPNENYPDKADQRWSEVDITVIADPNSALQSVISGRSQWVQGSQDQLSAAENAGLEVGNGQATTYALYLEDRDGAVVPALADERVRQALNHAVDRDAIATLLGGDPVAQIVPDGSIGYNPDAEDVYAFDPDAARDLLAEAGYADGFSIPISVPAFDPLAAQFAEVIAEQYAAIGVTLEMTTLTTFPDFAQAQASGAYAATVFGWGGASMFSVAQNIVLPTGILNPFHTSDDELNDLYSASAALSGDAAEASWQEFSLLVTEKAWFVPAAAVKTIYFAPAGFDPAGDGLFYPNPLFF